MRRSSDCFLACTVLTCGGIAAAEFAEMPCPSPMVAPTDVGLNASEAGVFKRSTSETAAASAVQSEFRGLCGDCLEHRL